MHFHSLLCLEFLKHCSHDTAGDKQHPRLGQHYQQHCREHAWPMQRHLRR